MQVFTLGGSFSGDRNQDKTGEFWNTGSDAWTLLEGVRAEAILSDDPQGAFRTDNYGFFFAWTGNSGVEPPRPVLVV